MKVRYLMAGGGYSTAYTDDDYKEGQLYYTGQDKHGDWPLVLTWNDKRDVYEQIVTPMTREETECMRLLFTL